MIAYYIITCNNDGYSYIDISHESKHVLKLRKNINEGVTLIFSRKNYAEEYIATNLDNSYSVTELLMNHEVNTYDGGSI